MLVDVYMYIAQYLSYSWARVTYWSKSFVRIEQLKSLSDLHHKARWPIDATIISYYGVVF